MAQKRIFWRRSLDMAVEVRFLKELLSRLPQDETEAISATSGEIARLTTELRKMWDVAP